MSFELHCETCGAPSGPSVGICPYCKTSFANAVASNPAMASLKDAYEKGLLKQALSQALALKDSEQMQNDPTFLCLYGKILIEAEGPSAQIKSCFAKAAALNSAVAPEAQLYIDMLSAKSMFREGLNDPGEQWFKKMLAEHPNNPHLLFIMGAHLFWVDRETQDSSRYLEQCVQLHPNFARAWGCLFAVYKFLKSEANMKRCGREFLRLEDDLRMKKYIEEQMVTVF